MVHCVIRILVVLWMVPMLLSAQTPPPGNHAPDTLTPDADWVRLEDLPPQAVQSAAVAKARLESRDRGTQLSALSWLEQDLQRYGSAVAQLTAVPLLVELASRQYRVLQFPPGYLVDAQVRAKTLELLGRMGGAAAVRQLVASLQQDPDPTVRGYAALVVAGHPDANPDTTMDALSMALYRAHRSTAMRENQVALLLHAMDRLVDAVVLFDAANLARQLVDVVTGSYSLAVRSHATRLLERLAER